MARNSVPRTSASSPINRAFPEVATSPGGEVIVVWEAQGQDGGSVNDATIRGQRYQLVE